MSGSDYDIDGEEEQTRESADRLRRGDPFRGLRIVPSLEKDEPRRWAPADEEVRELIRQIQRPVKKKVPLIDDLPPAA